MLRKIVTTLILLSLAIVVAAFAVANRQLVVVSFDPFNEAHPAYTLEVRLYLLILTLVIAGVVVGGIAAWLRQGRWRRTARLAQARARELAVELDRLQRSVRPVELPPAATPIDYQARLSIPPPAA